MKEKSQLLGKSCLAEQLLLFTYLLASDSFFNQENPYYSTHSSEIRGLQSAKSSGETLQNLPYFIYKETQVIFFLFLHFVELYIFPYKCLDDQRNIDQGIRTRKCKVTRNEKMVKNFVEFFLLLHKKLLQWNISLDANLLFLKSVHTYHEILKLQQTR